VNLRKLPRGFYLRPTLMVAGDLLGLFLVRKAGRHLLVGRIVEVEAYLGERDSASHAYRGRTKRNEAMFQKGGHLYVYFTYGMHFCCNVVTEGEGRGRAVLLRAVEPVSGVDVMIRNRVGSRRHSPIDIRKLCSGPARLCQAFGIVREDNGSDLCGRRIWVARESMTSENVMIGQSTRIGITRGREHKWRFFVRGNPSVSRHPLLKGRKRKA
jgi:DNA-3-methyladenine glycosylase